MSHLIAVVDDDVEATEAVASLLQASGFAVACFPSGDAFLSAYDFVLPDAVVLDLAMPGTNGVEVLRTLRHEKTAAVPVIILSGQAEGRELAEVRRLGAAATLRKPIEVVVLSDALERALVGRGPVTPAAKSTPAAAPPLAAAPPKKTD